MSSLTKRLCPCATDIDEGHGYGCEITGGWCAFLLPDSMACKAVYLDDDLEEIPEENQ